jgi:putative DNA primase/helicase
MVQGFPFDGANMRTGSSAANYLAWLLTPAIRPLLPVGANVPIALFDAALPGSGKDLLAGTSSLIYTGSAGAVRQAPDSNDEWRKQITSMLLAGQQVHVFSNMSGVLDSDALAGVVTSPNWSDRKLGASEDVSFAVNLTLGITANNLTLGRDFPRRTYSIYLDAQREDPASRTFAIPDLSAWVLEHRNELLGAVLSLCELWIKAGRPEAEITWSSYTPWARIVGGILEHAGVGRFIANRDDRVGYDPDNEELSILLTAIHEKVGEGPMAAKDIIAKVGLDPNAWPQRFIAPSGNVVVNAQSLGMWLRERSGRYAGGYRIDVQVNRATKTNEITVTAQ